MKQNPVFLLSFLPGLVYWALEYYYNPQIALIGGITIAIVEIVFEKLVLKHVHRLSILNFALLVLLGGLGLLAGDGIWFKLQPSFSSIAMVLVFSWYRYKKRSLMYETMIDLNQKNPLPFSMCTQLEKHMIVLFIIHSLLMAFIAISSETNVWLFFKTVGFYILIVFFLVFEFFWAKSQGINEQ